MAVVTTPVHDAAIGHGIASVEDQRRVVGDVADNAAGGSRRCRSTTYPH